ncbi:hypothetical protein [Rhodococcus sp. MEB041]|uniref:hypothetical protein n=1 Tax=Rhodococcus sp. MEB041 TaxID=3040323 RepID=UPI00254BCF56|nr:hypothetical protein [Rhodococcus sp. MEB041]
MDGQRIMFTVRDVSLILLSSVVSFIYCIVSWGSPVLGLLSALTLVTFVLAEARLSLDLGRSNFWSYLVLLTLKVLLPLLFLWAFELAFDGLDLTITMVCIISGNLLCCLINPLKSWELTSFLRQQNAIEWVGLMNVGLWVVSSNGRLVMNERVTAYELAVFTLAYALVDRAFRSVQTAYVSKKLSRALSGEFRQQLIPWITLVVTLGLVSVALLPFGSSLLSSGKYPTGFGLASLLSMAGAIMLLSSPLYLYVIGSQYLKVAAITALLISAVSVLANIALVRLGGSSAVAAVLAVSYLAWLLTLFALFRRGRSPQRVRPEKNTISIR